MSEVARKLLGMTDAQIHNADFRTSRSSKDIDTRNAWGDVRVVSGRIVSPEDLNPLRKKLRRRPKALR